MVKLNLNSSDKKAMHVKTKPNKNSNPSAFSILTPITNDNIMDWDFGYFLNKLTLLDISRQFPIIVRNVNLNLHLK